MPIEINQDELVTCSVNLDPLMKYLKEMNHSISTQEVNQNNFNERIEELQSKAFEYNNKDKEYLLVIDKLEKRIQQLEEAEDSNRAAMDDFSNKMHLVMFPTSTPVLSPDRQQELMQPKQKNITQQVNEPKEHTLAQNIDEGKRESTNEINLQDHTLEEIPPVEEIRYVTYKELMDVYETIMTDVAQIQNSAPKENKEADNIEKATKRKKKQKEAQRKFQEKETAPQVASHTIIVPADSKHIDEKLETFSDRLKIHDAQMEDLISAIEDVNKKLEINETLIPTTPSPKHDNYSINEESKFVDIDMLKGYITKRDLDISREKIMMSLDELKKNREEGEFSLRDCQKSIQECYTMTKKLDSKFEDMIENHEILKEITGSQNESQGNSMDLSAVFSKLSDLRNVHETSAENMRKAIDDSYDCNKITSKELKDMQSRMAISTKLRISQVVSEVETQKVFIERALHIHGQIKINVQDWRSPLDAMMRSLRKGVDGPIHARFTKDLRGYSRRFYCLIPLVAYLQTAPITVKNALERLGNLSECLSEETTEIEGIQTLSKLKEHIYIISKLVEDAEENSKRLSKDLDRLQTHLDELFIQLDDGKPIPISSALDDSEPKKIIIVEQENKECQTRDVAASTPQPILLAPPSSQEPQQVPKRVNELNRQVSTLISRLELLEDEMDSVQSNIGCVSQNMLEKVDLEYLAKVKTGIYSKLTQMQAAFMSPNRPCIPESIPEAVEKITMAEFYDDSAIRSSLEQQASMIADLCKQLPEEALLPENNSKDKDESQDESGRINIDDTLGQLTQNSLGLQNKLEGISERVADLFEKMQRNVPSRSPDRNVIPILNNSHFMTTFMSSIEDKLAEMRDVTAEDMKRMRSQLHKVIKSRIKKAVDTRSHQHDIDSSTAIGKMCLACNRPVAKIEEKTTAEEPVQTIDVHMPTMMAQQHHQQPQEKEYVYRGGFKMPVTEKKSNRRKGSGLKESRKILLHGALDALVKEVHEFNDQIVDETMGFSPKNKKSNEDRRPMPPKKKLTN